MNPPKRRPLAIRKYCHRAAIYLESQRIVGTSHIPQNRRLSDFLNLRTADVPFIPPTDVRVLAEGG